MNKQFKRLNILYSQNETLRNLTNSHEKIAPSVHVENAKYCLVCKHQRSFYKSLSSETLVTKHFDKTGIILSKPWRH